MKIKEFIQTQVIIPRLQKSGVLVVYDSEQRYRALCLELADESRKVVDASTGSIASRLDALDVLQALGQRDSKIHELLVYVPASRPLSDEDKQRDPFALYGECGQVFPEKDSDEYHSLCLRLRAENPTEIRRIFTCDPNPSFEVIDQVGGGIGWPVLRARMGAESAYDLLFALLTPTDAQIQALRSGASGVDLWAAEVHSLCESTLGLKFLTRLNSLENLGDELWRFLLFSEFVFDLPGELPAALSGVPRARLDARPLVEDLCDRLRNDKRYQTRYVERAETVEKELQLPELCRSIADLGVRDTFPFEERTCFRQALDALRGDNLDGLRHTLARHARSVWVGRGENQTQWLLLESAGALLTACQDAETLLPEAQRSLDGLLDAYLTSLRQVDHLQREFEQAWADLFSEGGWELGAASAEVEAATAQARHAYRCLSNKLQEAFVRQLERSGWPPAGRLANASVLDKLIAPRLQESGRRVALLLIDALRYELGVELHKQLAGDGQVELQAACAPLPTITPVGMAALLPGADGSLRLVRQEDGALPCLEETPVLTVAQRMELLRKRFGQRFAETSLTSFLKTRAEPEESVELLVIRSNEMDEQFEQNPETALGLIGRTFNQIRAAIHKLRTLGFQEAMIVADHGFYLNFGADSGDVCVRPAGSWVSIHDRMLLGAGAGDSANLVLPAENLGILGDFNQAALPRAMAAYRAGLSYFHGGASLQEALVPVISLRLSAVEPRVASPAVTLSYKRGARKITTRLPVVEISVDPLQTEMFSALPSAIEICLEAQDPKGRVVGEAKLGGLVNPATNTILINHGQTVQITLKMDLEYEGKFSVKALDPQTRKGLAKALELETDYTV